MEFSSFREDGLVETLFQFFHNAGDGGIWENFDEHNSQVVAEALAPTVRQWAESRKEETDGHQAL